MSIFELAIGWLAPTECIGCGLEGSSLCEACHSSEIIPFGERCYQCNKMSPGGRTCPACRPHAPSHVWVTTDYENLAKELVRKLKFGHQRAAALPLSDMMAETLLAVAGEDYLKAKEYLIVPVPTATSRVRERSFDHTDLLARKLSTRLGLESGKVLGRLGQERQVGAKRAARQKQAGGNYYVRQGAEVKSRNILLVDDVVTTGATLMAATTVLRKAGAKSVDAAVFAKKL